MNTIDNGGPAFPVGSGDMRDPTGMSLRDYFAAKALQGLVWSDIAMWPEGADVSDKPTDAVYMARTAYLIADAMLDARKEAA